MIIKLHIWHFINNLTTQQSLHLQPAENDPPASHGWKNKRNTRGGRHLQLSHTSPFHSSWPARSCDTWYPGTRLLISGSAIKGCPAPVLSLEYVTSWQRGFRTNRQLFALSLSFPLAARSPFAGRRKKKLSRYRPPVSRSRPCAIYSTCHFCA